MRVRPSDPQYLEFIASYSTEIQKLVLAARKLVLEEAPDAIEFVYQVYTVADHFSFTERPSDAFVFTTTHTGWVNLGFNFGAVLPDPKGLLRGEGKIIRHVRVATAADLAKPGVRELVRAAMELAERPEGKAGRPRMIVRTDPAARRAGAAKGRRR